MRATVALLRHGGSHLIRPVVSRLGFKITEPGNFGAPLDRADGKVVVFLRDPRDRVVSKIRWRLNKDDIENVSQTEMDERIHYLLTEGGAIAEMEQWSRIWCHWPRALKVKFEDFKSNGPAEVQRIADHLGVSCDPVAVHEEVYGNARTYTGKHSNWTEYFGLKSRNAWVRGGGDQIVEVMGY